MTLRHTPYMTPAKANTYFISDLHLGAGYISSPRQHEETLATWLREIEPYAKRLFMLGDVMDYWYEYRTVAPRGFVRFLGALAHLADSGTEIVWLKGNHDIWIFDYLPEEIGLSVADGVYVREIDGKIFVMEHGDGVGEIDRGYCMMRKVFRNRFCQWLYGAIHPRWTIAFAHGWSKKSRKQSKECRPEVVAREMKRLTSWAVAYNDSQPEGEKATYFVFGHLHCPARQTLPDCNAELIVLGEAFKSMSYAVWDGHSLELKTMNKSSKAKNN